MRRRLAPRPGFAPPCLAALGLLALFGATQDAAFAQNGPAPCDPDNGGITLPEGFCATVVADSLGPARHLVVSPNGDIFIAIRNTRGRRGGVLALRDTTGDGKADVSVRFGDNGGSGIAWRDGYLYFATDDAVLRYRIPSGTLEPDSPPDTIVYGLPAERGHAAKTIALGQGDDLFVNIGSLSNSCQVANRQPHSLGQDPCLELQSRAGIWRFSASKLRQTQADGEHFATGLRNVVALTYNHEVGALYGLQHGRDQLHAHWPELFTEQQSADLPSEEFVRIDRGTNFGWPYCYHDWQQNKKVLAPEYGGNGKIVGRCEAMDDPFLAFPGHWAPNAVIFYNAKQFPPRYHHGAFIAFHGSWNRAPLPQEGYNVVFVPFRDGRVTGEYSVFADGFRGVTGAARGARHRPTGLALGPGGELYISDDAGGRIWRVIFRPDALR